MSEKTVFISYRRDVAGKAFARSIKQELTHHGYDAFLDVDDISEGYWAKQILAQVPKRAHFLLLITPGALDGCSNPEDWIRREFELARDHSRVPAATDVVHPQQPAETKTLVLDDIDEVQADNTHVIYLKPPEKKHLSHLMNMGNEPEQFRLPSFPHDVFYTNLEDEDRSINAGESKSLRLILTALAPEHKEYPFEIQSTKHKDSIIRVSIRLQGDWKGGKTGVYLVQTRPVGSYPANPWGLYDMHGNVSEWTCSIYTESYAGSENTCVDNSVLSRRVIRGGSWNSNPLPSARPSAAGATQAAGTTISVFVLPRTNSLCSLRFFPLCFCVWKIFRFFGNLSGKRPW